jgi:hypothetical protein
MGIPLPIAESCYHKETLKRVSDDCIYPIGIDHSWFMSSNEL